MRLLSHEPGYQCTHIRLVLLINSYRVKLGVKNFFAFRCIQIKSINTGFGTHKYGKRRLFIIKRGGQLHLLRLVNINAFFERLYSRVMKRPLAVTVVIKQPVQLKQHNTACCNGGNNESKSEFLRHGKANIWLIY